MIRGSARDYLERHPASTDALLVVEIAKPSQGRDRRKAGDYARGGVPVYWLLDLEALDVHTEPDPETGRYGRVRSLGAEDTVELPEIGVSWTVGSLLP